MAVKAFLFDLDGTLVDSMWMWKDIDIAYLRRFHREYTPDLQEAIEGMSFHETAAYFKERYQIQDSIEQMMADWNEMARETYRTKTPLKPGVLRLLRLAREAGIKLGVVTSNSPELTREVLRATKVEPFFDVICTSVDVERGKPDPECYLTAAVKLHVAPEDCLVFEDMRMGIQAAHRAGMRVCAVADAFSEKDREEKQRMADYFVESMEEVAAWEEARR